MSVAKRVEQAIAKDGSRPTVKINRFRNFEDLIEVETEMEKRGYAVTGWLNNRWIVFGYAPEKIQKEKSLRQARREANSGTSLKFLMRSERHQVRRNENVVEVLLWPDRIEYKDENDELRGMPPLKNFSCRPSESPFSKDKWDVVILFGGDDMGDVLGFWGDTYSDDQGEADGFVADLRKLSVPEVNFREHEIYYNATFRPD